MALTATTLAAGAAGQNNVSHLLELPGTLDNTEEIIHAAKRIPTAYTTAPRPYI
jgi:hypothetical protein